MRHPKPKILIDHETARANVPPYPHICHTCDFYDMHGKCERFGEAPPAEFAATPDACAEWVDVIPF